MHLLDTLDDSAKRKEWRWERVGWIVILVIVLLALIGFFGEGPASYGSVRAELAGGEARIDFERWNRLDHVSLLVVHVHAPHAIGSDLKVAFSANTASDWTIRSSYPAGEGELGPDGGNYAFKVDDWTQPFALSFEYVPERAGRVATLVTLTPGESAPAKLTLDQWIHP